MTCRCNARIWGVHDSAAGAFGDLLTRGLSPDQAAAWAPLRNVPRGFLVRHARAWHAAGYPPDVAAAWNRHGLRSQREAALWIAAGYTPSQADVVERHCLWVARRSMDAEASLANDWLSTNFSAEMVLRFLAARIDSVAEAQAIMADMPADEDPRPRLAFLTALRGSA